MAFFQSIYRIYCRIYQAVAKIIILLLPWREPELLEGENSLLHLPNLLKREGVLKPLIVTDKGIVEVGLMEPLLERLEEEGIRYTIYDGTVPNPTIDNIEEAVSLYYKNNCDGIIAFGGGSPIDCAKLTGARIVKRRKKVEKMHGLFKILKRLPPLFVVPTTAGTGAEATLAAVFTNSETNEKFPVMDISIIPHFAVLDPLLTLKLPPHITAETGMDALTHAVEAYIGRSNTKNTEKWAIEATKLIFDNIYEAYSNGDNIEARKNMQKASYYAGAAFTQAFVGYVHALAHAIGGFYNLSHGLLNAVLLPIVLEYYGESVYKPLAELAEAIGIAENGDSDKEKAEKFIRRIRHLNKQMVIPKTILAIQEKDIPLLVKRALREANPLYPVPKILFEKDMVSILQAVRG